MENESPKCESLPPHLLLGNQIKIVVTDTEEETENEDHLDRVDGDSDFEGIFQCQQKTLFGSQVSHEELGERITQGASNQPDKSVNDETLASMKKGGKGEIDEAAGPKDEENKVLLEKRESFETLKKVRENLVGKGSSADSLKEASKATKKIIEPKEEEKGT